MVRRDVVAARLEKLREYLAVLKIIRRYELTTFVEDPVVHGAAERYLQLTTSVFANP